MSELTDAQLDELERVAKSAINAGEMKHFDCHHLSHQRYVGAVLPPTVLALVREVRRLRHLATIGEEAQRRMELGRTWRSALTCGCLFEDASDPDLCTRQCDYHSSPPPRVAQ